MADAARRQAGDGAGGLCTNYGQVQFLQRGGEGGTTTNRSLDGTSNALQGKRTAEPHVTTGKDTLDDKTADGGTKAIGGRRLLRRSKGR